MTSLSDRRPPRITVVIPNWNGLRWIERCLAALRTQEERNFETVVVDNGSTDGSIERVEQNFPEVAVVRLGRNTGFAAAVNVGIRRSTANYVALLNSDTEAAPTWLSVLASQLDGLPSDVAAVAPQILCMDDPSLTENAGDELSWFGAATKRGYGQPASDYDDQIDIFSPCAAAALYRRSFLLELGCFDEVFFAYLEDVDLGLRGRLRGYRYLYCPKAKVVHRGHGSSVAFSRYVTLMTRNRLLLFVKNVPASLLFRHALRLAFGQIYFLIVYVRPLSSIIGYLSFLKELPSTLRARRNVMRTSILTSEEINALLSTAPIEPSLSSIAKRGRSMLWASSRAWLQSFRT